MNKLIENQGLKEMVQQTFGQRKVTREALNSLVDRAADLIRTAVNYKFILVLLFLKRLNDLWKAEKFQVKTRLVKESGLSEEEAWKEAEREVYHTFNIPRQFLWDEVTKDVKNLPERLATAIGETAKLNPQLQGVINRVDFLEFARNQENRELLRQLVSLIDWSIFFRKAVQTNRTTRTNKTALINITLNKNEL